MYRHCEILTVTLMGGGIGVALLVWASDALGRVFTNV